MLDYPPGYDLKALRAFLIVVETGGMTKAAARLGLTQSSVSQIIANLEAAVGTVLLDRAARPLAPTPAGAVLLEQARGVLAKANDTLLAVREPDRHRFASLTLAMAESFANTVGPRLVRWLPQLAASWRLWSGISPEHQAAFTSHRVDLIVTTGDELDGEPGLELHPLLRECFVLVSPVGRPMPDDGLPEQPELPFLRYTLRSTIGRQIERQLARLRLDFASPVEFDTATAQLAAVADGMGFSLTTPMCLLQERHVLDRLQVTPLTRGRFARRLTLVARAGDLGDAPAQIAHVARHILRDELLPTLTQPLPWLSGELEILREEGAATRP